LSTTPLPIFGHALNRLSRMELTCFPRRNFSVHLSRLPNSDLRVRKPCYERSIPKHQRPHAFNV
ncbi:hypothetical protein T11_11262, partial [Trichinella zimbabwensis]